MARKRGEKPLFVLMNGLLVGHLERLSAMGVRFRYDASWLERAGAMPISLSMPLTSTPYEGDKAYAFFDNLLPDNPRIRARIQTRFCASTDHAYDLLASVGKDCIGAIQLTHQLEASYRKIEVNPLDDKEIAAVLNNYRDAPLGMTKDHDDFRISLAGAQEKSAFLYYENRWCQPLGPTPTSHIFKLPIGLLEHQQMDLSDSCENEFLCGQIAKAFGLSVANSTIEYFEDVKVLVVERFDRKMMQDSSWIKRLPQEDMCQALGYSPNLKYEADGGPGIEKIMRLLLESRQASVDREHFIRAQVLFWLLAAIDGHAKNFSVFLQPQGRFQLTPLYDILSAHPLVAKKQLQKQKIKMAMALRGRNTHNTWHMGLRRHFLSTAKAVQYSQSRTEAILDEMIRQVDSVIAQVSRQLPDQFPDDIAGPIFEGMRAMAAQLS